MSNHNSLTAVFDRVEGELVVLKFEDGQELAVSKGLLPADCHEGSHLVCNFTAQAQAEADQASRARQLLTDILKGS